MVNGKIVVSVPSASVFILLVFVDSFVDDSFVGIEFVFRVAYKSTSHQTTVAVNRVIAIKEVSSWSRLLSVTVGR